MSELPTARHRARAWVLLLAALASQACAPSSPEPLGSAASSIVEGKPAATCEWPSVGVLLPSGCSGALIQRRAFATAAHCLFDAGGRLETPSTVLFGQNRYRPELQAGVSSCFLSEPKTSDLAVCTLSEDVPDVPIIPLMAGCETEQLAPGETAVEVGFGETSAGPAQDEGNKSWLEVTVVRARSDEPYLEVSAGTQAGEYYGDSGGPLFFKMPDDTWRLVGTDSGSPDIVPGSTAPRFSVYANVPYFLDWAERVSGLDLTPCHDALGWRPDLDCAAFPVSQPYVEDSWASHCRNQPTARPRPSCPESTAAGEESSGGAQTSPTEGGADAGSAPARARNDSLARRIRATGGGCSQAAGSPGTWSSALALFGLFVGLRLRRSRLGVPAAYGSLGARRPSGTAPAATRRQ